MKVLIVGATGQLGQDLKQVFGAQALGLSHQDLDVTDGVAVLAAVREAKPNWVVNTAAFHLVDDCEVNPYLTFAVNGLGALNVARAAHLVNASVVFFSSDYVFGGENRKKGQPYLESAVPKPINLYGISKYMGEQLVAYANPRHLIIRSAGLYGTTTSRKGWTFPELMLHKARTDGLVRVVTDQVLSPTYTADLSVKVKELVEQGATGLFHLTNSGECSWFEFAQATFDLAGIQVKMEPISTQQSQRRAKRPRYSALASERLSEINLNLLRSWQDALSAYLQAKELL